MKRYTAILLILCVIILAPVRVLAAGWTPTDAGLVVDLKPGDQFLLSVMINGNEYFVCDNPTFTSNADRSPFTYGEGHTFKLISQPAGAKDPMAFSVWDVDTALTREKNKITYALGGISYVMTSSTGYTLETSGGNFKFLGALSSNKKSSNLCDVVFVVPTVQARTNMDPNGTLNASHTAEGRNRGTGDNSWAFDGKMGVNEDLGLVYREVYMLEIPRTNDPISYTNAALVTFNTTNSVQRWSNRGNNVYDITANPGTAAYIYADGKHNPTPRTLFRLYIIQGHQFSTCPNTYFFAHEEQDYVKYRQSNTLTDSTDFRKIYTTDHHHCMERVENTKYYQTESVLTMFEDDSTYYYVGKNNEFYSSAKGMSLNGTNAEPKALSHFRSIRRLPIRPMAAYGDTLSVPVGATGRVVVDTTSMEENLGATFDPAGYFFHVNSGKNVEMRKENDSTWITDEMWTIEGDYMLLSGEVLLYTGASFDEKDPGVRIPGWSVMEPAPGIPVYGHPGETAAGKSGWARVHTNRTAENGDIEFVLADSSSCLIYDNNGFLGVKVPNQYLEKNGNTNKVVVREARLKAGFVFLGWATEKNGDVVYWTRDSIGRPGKTLFVGDSITLTVNDTTFLYAKATYTGTYNVAVSFKHSNGKRYFVTNPTLAASDTTSSVYLRARSYTDWTNVWQGMSDAYNSDPHYLSTYMPIGQPTCLECDPAEYVLDPHRRTIRGYTDSLVLYESHAMSDSTYIGLYYVPGINTLLANNSWAGLFQSSEGWPDFQNQSVDSTKLFSTHYLHDDKNEFDRDTIVREARNLPPYIKYMENTGQFDGVDGETNGTTFHLSNIVVADQHYVILPDTTDVDMPWTDSITFDYHENQLPVKHVWSKLIGKQLMAAMFLDDDTVYFHPNDIKTKTTASDLRLSLDYRLTHAFSYIRDARVESMHAVATADKPVFGETGNDYHCTVTSGQSSPILNVQYGGNYIDMVDTLRVLLNPTGSSKIKDYYGRWKTGADGLHISADGSRYRDILVKTKTYHYGPTQKTLRLVPTRDSYNFGSLSNVSEDVTFTLELISWHELMDVQGNLLRIDTISIADTTSILNLTSGTSCSLYHSDIFTIGTKTRTGVRLTTQIENTTALNRDTLYVTTTVTLDGVPTDVSIKVPLLQVSTIGTELIWSAVCNGLRYFIMAEAANKNTLRIQDFSILNSRLVRNKAELILGSYEADGLTDRQHIRPWKWYDVNPSMNQLTLRTEYGINRHFYLNGSTFEASASDSTTLTFHFDTTYTNSSGNYEEIVKLQCGPNQWLKLEMNTGTNKPQLVVVADSADASFFSWAYMIPEYHMLNNGAYPNSEREEFGYNTVRTGTIQTRYQAYLDYSMLLNNQTLHLCKKTEPDIADLIHPSQEWKTFFTDSIIPDRRVAQSSGLRISAIDTTTLTTTIAQSGPSPLEVKYNGQYVNIVDTLDFRITLQDGAPDYRFDDSWSSYSSVEDAHLKIPLVRQTFHEISYDSIVCAVENDEYNYSFPAALPTGEDADSTHTFVLSTERHRGRKVYNVNNDPVTVIKEETVPVDGMDLTNASLAAINFVDDYGNKPTWCRIIDKTENTITVKCFSDGIRSPRVAHIYLSYLVVVGGKNRYINFHMTVSQASLFEFGNNQRLSHSAGASGDPKTEDGRQQVHENKRILYYYNPRPYNEADQNVELPLRERGFYGWWRWYREGKDQNGVDVSDTDIPDSVWITPPRNVGKVNNKECNYPFRIIGDSVWVDEADHSKGKKLVTMGRYTVFRYPSVGYGTKWDPPSKTPQVAAPFNKDTVTYAVDISNYYDNLPLSVDNINQVDTGMLEKLEVITEPTLSIREIYELHPWTEMAARLENYKDTIASGTRNLNYLEDHVVMAPIGFGNGKGGRLLLKTEQRYIYDHFKPQYKDGKLRREGHSESLLGYYMRDDNWTDWDGDEDRQDTMIWCGGWDVNCYWYTYDPLTQRYDSCDLSITVDDDFLNVTPKGGLAGNHTDTVYYCLRARSKATTVVNGEDVTENGAYWFNICRYKVIYHNPNKYGPLLERNQGGVTKAIMTNDEIEQDYEILERLDFDYNEPGSDYQIYPHPLPWTDASYGYTYPLTSSALPNRFHSQTDFPGPGEYALINKIPYTQYWRPIEQHGGADKGYMLYCDGMSASGQVAALTLRTKLCEGQKLYFSGYIANAGKNDNAKPNFTFSVQGAKDLDGGGIGEWEDITSYMTGDIPKSNTAFDWYQIFFPIEHAKAYQHFRVRIYNMSSDFDGNDFVIDDMCIFATKPPLIAYQANTKCVEHNESDSIIHMVLRVDYQGFVERGYNDANVYYTVEQLTLPDSVQSFVPMIDHYLNEGRKTGVPASAPDTVFGWIHMPANDYEPDDESDSIFLNLNQLADRFEHSVDSNAINPDYPLFRQGYIKENLDGDVRPVLYVVHKAKMSANNRYTVRMSLGPEGLMNSDCAMTSNLKVSNRMMLMLNGIEQDDNAVSDICGNVTHTLSLRVRGTLIENGTAPVDLAGSCVNDWLLYGDTAEASSLARYGYYYSDIAKVVKDILRYEPAPGETNVNQFAPSLGSVSRATMTRIRGAYPPNYLKTTDDPYVVLSNLVNNGYLVLYQSDLMSTIQYGDSVQYVVFPIIGTGSDEMHSQNMDVCPNPLVIKLKSKENELGTPLIVGGLHRDSTQLSKPVIVLADAYAISSEIRVPVDSIRTSIGVSSVELTSTDDPYFRPAVHRLEMVPDRTWPGDDMENYYQKGDTILLTMSTSNNYNMRPGYNYTFTLEMVNPLGQSTGLDNCPIGEVPITIAYVPDYLRWDPRDSLSNQWNKPDNWIGITAQNQPIHAEARFAPLPSTKVIVPEMTNGMPYPVMPATITTKDSVQEVGFAYNVCDAIRFLPGAAIGQQQNLEYNNAIIDMPIPQQKWALRTAPVAGMISGDIFMADADLSGETSPWEIGEFDARGRNNSTGNASFWLSLYSRTTNHVGNGTNVADTTYTAKAEWSKVTNGMTLPLPSAHGWAVYSSTASGNAAAVRLPKNDDKYYYYTKSGNKREDLFEADLRALRNTVADGKAGKLAFYPDGGGSSQTYNLKNDNDVETDMFVFGNPTMGYIDIWGFIDDNNTWLAEEIDYMDEGGYHNSVTKATATASALTNTITNQQRYLPPMHAMVIKTKSGVGTINELNVTLNANRIVTAPVVSAPAGAPRRSAAANSMGIMTVTAVNPVSSRCVSRLLIGQGFNNEILEGEDALLTTLNIDNFSMTNTPTTPFNIYAVENGKGLSIDLRNNVENIPVSFYMSNLPYEPVTYLWFTGVNAISGELVLYDALTDTQRRIIDGICLDIETPETSHQARYYIRRPDYDPNNGTDPIATGIDSSASDSNGEHAVKIVYKGNVYVLRNGHVYTMFGQKVR